MINYTIIQRWFREHGFRKCAWAVLIVVSTSVTAPSTSFAQRTDDLPTLNLDLPIRLDFSGSWEKDFRRSDNWEDELGRAMRIRQEAAARQRAQPGSGRSISAPPISIGNVNLSRSRGRGANIVDLARLAEYISRQSTLEITQRRDEIKIERSGEAALVCGTAYGIMETFANEHGVEVCGWDAQQLVFQIMLPDDLIIVHRFTVSSNQQQLSVITSISSKGGEPFNLIQVYTRYDAPQDEFDCVQTLSRGQVCNQVFQGQ
ncbi:MAG: hypothetical protein COA96_12850 [SAR86 cluster bacterium]|uniref:Secreted protein n=1 Tax=SAR86 cluster bacterium TaxID=2030880 RepID=A0A2A5AUM8_9GAMM|nr:MAG: hypothetical protein COA96_12850 [SAR86 cluster bacterium]